MMINKKKEIMKKIIRIIIMKIKNMKKIRIIIIKIINQDIKIIIIKKIKLIIINNLY